MYILETTYKRPPIITYINKTYILDTTYKRLPIITYINGCI
jgi:hypothetical protein